MARTIAKYKIYTLVEYHKSILIYPQFDNLACCLSLGFFGYQPSTPSFICSLYLLKKRFLYSSISPFFWHFVLYVIVF